MNNTRAASTAVIAVCAMSTAFCAQINSNTLLSTSFNQLPLEVYGNKGDLNATATDYIQIERNNNVHYNVSDVVIQAQKVLGVGKQHLAKIFRLSRQHIYNLINDPTGQNHKEETMLRSDHVKDALNVIQKVTSIKLGASALTCKNEGRNLIDVLCSDQIDLILVEHFAKEIEKRIMFSNQDNALPEEVMSLEPHFEYI